MEKNKLDKNKFEKNKIEKNKIEKKIGNFVANKPSKVHLILSGSGSRFISFIGALSFFNKIFPKFKDNLGIVSCSSGGSFIGMLLCLGYKIEDIKNLLINIGYSDVKDINVLSFLNKYGFDEGLKLIEIMKKLIFNKLGNENATFKDLYDIKGNHLVITGSCLNTYEVEYFDYISNPDMEIWKAVRISISIPIYYTAFEYKDKMYFDGAILDYFPINVISKYSNEINKNSDILISLKLKDINFVNNYRKISSFSDYMSNMIWCFISTIDKLRNDDYLNKEYISKNYLNEKNFYLVELLGTYESFNLELSDDDKNNMFYDAYKFCRKYCYDKHVLNSSNYISKTIIYDIINNLDVFKSEPPLYNSDTLSD